MASEIRKRSLASEFDSFKMYYGSLAELAGIENNLTRNLMLTSGLPLGMLVQNHSGWQQAWKSFLEATKLG